MSGVADALSWVSVAIAFVSEAHSIGGYLRPFKPFSQY